MISLFKDNSPTALKAKAKAAFKKTVELTSDSRNARSMRVRIALLSRAHLDKTFIEGAERTEVYLRQVSKAIVDQTERPPEPTASEYQKVDTATDEVWVYVPQDYADAAFQIGGRYQRTDISAEHAIDSMQGLLDQLCMYELRMDEPLEALQFLRDELAEQAAQEAQDASDAPDPTSESGT